MATTSRVDLPNEYLHLHALVHLWIMADAPVNMAPCMKLIVGRAKGRRRRSAGNLRGMYGDVLYKDEEIKWTEFSIIMLFTNPAGMRETTLIRVAIRVV